MATQSSWPPANPWLEKKRAEAAQRESDRLAARQSNPARQRFYWAVKDALRAGKLVEGPCSWKIGRRVCGERPTQAHHDSYEPGMELRVRWLCHEHHDVLTKAALRAVKRGGERKAIRSPGVVVLED